MSCEGCVLTIGDFWEILDDEARLLEWLYEHGVLRRSLSCEKCGGECTLRSDLRFVCGKTIVVRKGKKVSKSRCNFSASLRRGTWFERSKLSLKTACAFTMYWAVLRPPRVEFIERECGMSAHAVTDWSNFCRNVCVEWCLGRKEKLGGAGVEVEIDEAKIGKRKYNRGVEGKWVFGGFERGSKKLFVVGVGDRSASSLLEVIKEWILPGTTLISNCWQAYDCLGSEGYKHFAVNHSVNFVDPETGAGTRNIERSWREVRSSVLWYGRREEHYEGYMCEFLWKRSLPDHRDRLHMLFQELIGKIYNPHRAVQEGHPEDGAVGEGGSEEESSD